jgi:hypothetical protein
MDYDAKTVQLLTEIHARLTEIRDQTRRNRLIEVVFGATLAAHSLLYIVWRLT